MLGILSGKQEKLGMQLFEVERKLSVARDRIFGARPEKPEGGAVRADPNGSLARVLEVADGLCSLVERIDRLSNELGTL